MTHHRITGELNGRPLKTEAAVVVFGLGRYFGGGLMITPGASPQAGHFQVVLGQKLSRLDVLTLLPGLYFGKHLNHPRVTADYAGHIKIIADPPAYVEAEGELEGLTPIEAAIIPGALRIAAPSIIFLLFPNLKPWEPLAATFRLIRGFSMQASKLTRIKSEPWD